MKNTADLYYKCFVNILLICYLLNNDWSKTLSHAPAVRHSTEVSRLFIQWIFWKFIQKYGLNLAAKKEVFFNPIFGNVPWIFLLIAKVIVRVKTIEELNCELLKLTKCTVQGFVSTFQKTCKIVAQI